MTIPQPNCNIHGHCELVVASRNPLIDVQHAVCAPSTWPIEAQGKGSKLAQLEEPAQGSRRPI